MLQEWKPVNKLPFHYGFRTRAYANRQFRWQIKLNYDMQRFFYNHLIAYGHEYYQTKRFCKGHTQYAYRHPLLAKIQLKSAVAVLDISKRIGYVRDFFWFLNRPGTDSNVFAHSEQNYRRAWHMYNLGLQRVPTFHKKDRYDAFYDTSCVYRKGKSQKYHHGNVKFLSRTLVQMPKVKRPIRISKIPMNIWKLYQNHDVRIGSVKVEDDNVGHVYISFSLASDKPFRRLSSNTEHLAAMGYDLNVSNFLASTDPKIHDASSHYKPGFISNPHYYEHAEARLKKLQRCMSRKENHAENQHRNLLNCKDYQRNRIRFAVLSRHVKNQRFDFLQRWSTRLFESQELLVGENLKSSNMLKNHRLAKSIQSVGWRAFIGMLEYKAKMYRKIFVLINPAYTTQMCSNCGYVCNKKDGTHLTLKDRKWTCPKCGAHHIRDLNAATNILNKGIQALTKYLPRKFYSVQKATRGRKKILVHGKGWLKYLASHYYGVQDSSRSSSQTLIPKH